MVSMDDSLLLLAGNDLTECKRFNGISSYRYIIFSGSDDHYLKMKKPSKQNCCTPIFFQDRRLYKVDETSALHRFQEATLL